MEQKEMMSEFNTLYGSMVTSNKPENMRTFGDVMKCMMKDMVTMKPELAQEYIGKLESIKWKNYLTKKEAIAIVSEMNPNGGWDYGEWEKAMEAQDARMEDSPYYNKYALFVTMNMIFSDSANTIAVIAGKTLQEISKDEMFADVHMLALDKLEDKDGNFGIRQYFHV